MRNQICILSCFGILLVGVATASAQSLTEVAKKEKERRDRNREAGIEAKEFAVTGESAGENDAPPPDVGADLDAGTPPEAASDPSALESPGNQDDDDEQARAARAGVRKIPTESGDGEAWAAIYSRYLARYRAAANEIDQLSAELESVCKKMRHAEPEPIYGLRGNVVVMPDEGQNRCASIPGMLARLKVELAQIERDTAEDARRRGVLPGQARLIR